MHTKQQSGFTLVELAVVVFLVGLLASLGLSALNAQLASSRISDTKKKQEIIKDALISYLGRNKRLPCPATDNTGAENRIAATVLPPSHTYFPLICKGNFGFIPYATLGLPKSTVLDGWENFFSYAVSSQWTLTYSATIPVASNEFVSAATMAFNVGIPGTFTVNDRLPAPIYAIAIPPLSDKAAVFIVSHGKNGFGALTSKGTPNVPPGNSTDEFANVPNQTTWTAPAAFFQRAYTDNDAHPNGAFDDIILFLNLLDFITPLAKDGALKSAESQWADQVANINSSLIGYIISQNNSICTPPSLAQFTSLLSAIGIPTINTSVTTTTFSDPWGSTWIYDITLNSTTYSFSTSIPAAKAYTPTPPAFNPNNITFKSPLIGQLFATYPNFQTKCP